MPTSEASRLTTFPEVEQEDWKWKHAADFLSQGDTGWTDKPNDKEVDEDSLSVDDRFNWESEKQKKLHFFDDGTKSFFWRAHTLTVLFVIVTILFYVALVEEVVDDTQFNAKRGLVACIVFFISLALVITPDGPFLRPHPALWRLLFVVSIVYQIAMIFLLFQSAKDARQLLKHIDSSLGEPLAERSYSRSCIIYDSNRTDDPFHNLKDKMDFFVPTHFFGWWLKTLIVRDWWMCTVISIMFEILEYTLEHQLPNFSECWWDHWILDALLCNGVGIFCGMKTLQRFQVRKYCWRGLWSIPGYRGKLRRIFGQFGPHSWIDFDWKPTSSLGRWMAVLGITFVFLAAELNTFYLKFVLWVPPDHWLNLIRLVGILLWGAVSLRETYQYLDDSDCQKFGRQSWTMLSIVCTEFLIVAKFDPVTITKPVPRHISIFWAFGLLTLGLWTVWNFRIDRLVLASPCRTLVYSKSESSIILKTPTPDVHSLRKTKSSCASSSLELKKTL
ncbi:unnamed protein product [Allacma fusca]|uniref:Phosphatidylserine synthase n=1 Tax=Allacma fusca TaxID=39272 RepID=A0A8J2KYI5_9HEXA|nr:unnamed protein product [Allacma fusca]